MAFESVKTAGPIWEPKQTGSKKGGDLKAREPGDDSYIDGYYLGPKVIQGPNGDSTLHVMKMENVANDSLINGDLDDKKEVNIWGTGVLDDLLSKITPGSMVRVQWLGKKQPKRQGGNEYHDWDVLIDNEVEPIQVGAAHSVDKKPAEQPAAPPAQEPAPQTSGAGEGSDEEDDDLPF